MSAPKIALVGGGSFTKALAALSTDPLVRPECARPLLEDLLAGTRQWLPQFN